MTALNCFSTGSRSFSDASNRLILLMISKFISLQLRSRNTSLYLFRIFVLDEFKYLLLITFTFDFDLVKALLMSLYTRWVIEENLAIKSSICIFLCWTHSYLSSLESSKDILLSRILGIYKPVKLFTSTFHNKRK